MSKAQQIWAILVAHAGVSPDGERAFVRAYMAHEIDSPFPFEYRLVGSLLGPGGRVRRNAERSFLVCSEEERTGERDEIVATVNGLLVGA